MIINNSFFVQFSPKIHEITYFGDLQFQNFLGIIPTDPPRLAYPFELRFNLRRLLCFIGDLWKFLLRAVMRYQDTD